MASRYWVGGTGNWSDTTNHWTDISGGAPGTQGAEFMVNGGFNGNANGWSLQFSTFHAWTYAGNKVAYNSSSDGYLRQPTTILSRGTYVISFDLVVNSFVTGLVPVLLAPNSVDWSTQYAGNPITTSGHYSFTIIPSNFFNNAPSGIIGFLGSNVNCTLTNVSVKQAVSLPTSSDNVFIDSNSGLSGGTMTVNGASGICSNFSSTTGVSYTLSMPGTVIQLYGSLLLESGVTNVSGPSGIEFDLFATTPNNTITPNGCIFDFLFTFGTGSWILQSDLHLAKELNLEGGTFSANGYNVTATDFYFYSDAVTKTVVNMGSGIWNVTGNDVSSNNVGGIWSIDENQGQAIVINPNTSTIKLTDATSNTKTFILLHQGVGKTYNNIWFTGSGTGSLIFQGSNAFNEFRVDTPPHTVQFQAGTTTTINTPILFGSSGNLITIGSSTNSGHTLVKNGGGTVIADYLSISYSNATPSTNTWYAGDHSTDGGNNSGWIFTSIPARITSKFLGTDY